MWTGRSCGELFQEWGFHSLANQFRDSSRTTAAVQGELFSGDELFPFGANAPAETVEPGEQRASSVSGGGDWQAEYHLIDTEDKFEAFYRELRKAEAHRLRSGDDQSESAASGDCGHRFLLARGEAWYLALRGPEGAALLDPDATLARLRSILEDPGVAKINQNIKYDLLVLRGRGVQPRGVAGDPMVADYLLHAGERSHGLEELARRYLNHQVIPITDLIGKKSRKTPQLRMDQVLTERVAVYSGEDADVAWRLCELLEPQLGERASYASSTTTWKCRSLKCWPSWNSTASVSTSLSCAA